MIDGVKRAEVLLFSFFSFPPAPIHIQRQSEEVKAAEAVKHCLAHSPLHTHTHCENA